ncbi:MAG: adenylate kinase family protein [Nanoarchaeota archaeon]|nr:adenylate kinase family protein [Nanoarchaeota archaeon]MBU1135635.1 adenylate kinase family protein [Nanoarchaeota archaeon]MBU2520000.1 adenylate kinase family protein [Nanoarchaeota archaeon]
MIIAITGTPGTGKTEVAKLLAKELKWKLIELNKLAEEKNFYRGYDEERECKIVDINKLSREIKKMKENLILEGHFSHDMSCDLVIVLRCAIGELRKRMEKRGWPEQKIEENIEAEIMGICKEEAEDDDKDVLEIDTTGKTAENVTKEIKLKLKKGAII